MTSNPDYSVPVLDNVLCPSDFSKESLGAFHHALRAALTAGATLTLFHTVPDVASPWTEFPGIRETLERWALLPPGSPRSAVPELGIEIRRAVAASKNPVKSVLAYLGTHPADLIVLSTRSEGEGRASWLRQAIAEPIARHSGQMTLFLPEQADGFVAASDGKLRLQTILVPVTKRPSPEPALSAAARIVRRLRQDRGTFVLLHVGEAADMPDVVCPDVPGWEWKRLTRTGDVTHGILDTAGKQSVDLIIMSTSGRHGFLDALRGSQSELVLRRGRYPLLTIPEGAAAAAIV